MIFTKNIDFSDINECATGTDNCNVNAVCTNTRGSFICHCRSGYTGNGVACNGMIIIINVLVTYW